MQTRADLAESTGGNTTGSPDTSEEKKKKKKKKGIARQRVERDLLRVRTLDERA